MIPVLTAGEESFFSKEVVRCFGYVGNLSGKTLYYTDDHPLALPTKLNPIKECIVCYNETGKVGPLEM